MDTLKVIANTDSLRAVNDSLKNVISSSSNSSSLNIVLGIVLIVWTGIFLYLLNIDRRLKNLEKENKDK